MSEIPVESTAKTVWDETGELPRRKAAQAERASRVRAVGGGVLATCIGLAMFHFGHVRAAVVPLVIGPSTIVAGALLASARFQAARRLMDRSTELLGTFFAWVFLGPVYVLVVAPMGLVRRARGRDALKIRSDRATSNWRPAELEGSTERTF